MWLSWVAVLPDRRSSMLPGNPPDAGGVYLLVVDMGGEWQPFYAGQAARLSARLAQHWSASESNRCVKAMVSSFRCGYFYAEVASEAERNMAERALIRHYRLQKGSDTGYPPRRVCNDELPAAPDVSLNWPV